ncbi:hypothetical protein CLNEO_14690 [Anaerotignum neopropionicum]|uniref:DUF4867 domain-containing protein n=1 Tax=Anaerotignum neopropionicum TaxID=36847 RepID=A0A136WEK2_9FIRM|nr:DUF4867 family protein [Anaerotignum neopropionicum]KXL52927.1 hypothetical protein CLNEO_14690 [Anaerotignum neopropionicum]
MKIYSVFDKEFAPYGKILENYDTTKLLEVLKEKTPLHQGVVYEPSVDFLEELEIAKIIADNVFGGMPIQMGYCNGFNQQLNCLEYHRDSEINFGTKDFILLLAKEEEIDNGKLDTKRVKAFHCPGGVLAEVYATTLHYAPCCTAENEGFQVLVVLPKGTNTEKPEITAYNFEDSLLWARNKWLLAHAESNEAKQGAYVGLVGDNIDLSKESK